MTTTITVPLCVSRKIRSTKDLNDFYAYMEQDKDDLTYSFENEQETRRIDDLMGFMCYCAGHYDYNNVRRILGL